MPLSAKLRVGRIADHLGKPSGVHVAQRLTDLSPCVFRSENQFLRPLKNDQNTAVGIQRHTWWNEKNLHSSYTGQKRSIFVNYISDLQVTDIMVGETGFEPATSCSQSRRATGLRHSPNRSAVVSEAMRHTQRSLRRLCNKGDKSRACAARPVQKK